MMRGIDLHTHSLASDGTDSPAMLARLAAESGLAAFALTDHDTISGLNEAEEASQAYGISFIRGCEIAAKTPYGEAHFVLLWLPPEPTRLQQALSAIRKGREDRNLLILEKLAEHGFPLSMEEVLAEAGGETVARPHIAKALVRKGYAASIHDVFSTMLGCSKPMYVPRVLPSPAEVMAMAENEGATTVFAHPMLLRAPYEWLNDFISELSSLGLDALEAWHSEQDAAQTRSCIRLAEKHKLALSGGSDYHGSCKPHVALGTGRGNVNVPYSILEKLLKLRKIKKLPQYAI